MIQPDERLRSLWLRDRLIPVVRIDDPAWVEPLARILTEAGFGTLEVTLRTPVALEALAAFARCAPDLVVGAGTVTGEEQLPAVAAAGGRFAVSPGLDPPVVEAARAAGMPFVPGVVTPTEALAARRLGCRLLKFFPARPAGGPRALAAITAALGHTGLEWIPTGGVDAESLAEWLALPGVVACGGSWMVPARAMAAGDWQEVERLAKAARQAAGRDGRCDT